MSVQTLLLAIAVARGADPEPTVAPPSADDTVAFASASVDALDEVTGWDGHPWGSAHLPDMRWVGPNGPHRAQYSLDGTALRIGDVQLSGLYWEYDDDRLCTIVALIGTEYDAELLLRSFVTQYGDSTASDDKSRTWRGEKVRLVLRKQSDRLWIATWSWMELDRPR